MTTEQTSGRKRIGVWCKMQASDAKQYIKLFVSIPRDGHRILANKQGPVMFCNVLPYSLCKHCKFKTIFFISFFGFLSKNCNIFIWIYAAVINVGESGRKFINFYVAVEIIMRKIINGTNIILLLLIIFCKTE